MQVGGIQGNSIGLASAVSKASSVAYYDPKDTNQDGVVSIAEELAYALKHPESVAQTAATANSSSLNQYRQNGSLNTFGNTTNSMFDLYA
jgi:hypothetical protein